MSTITFDVALFRVRFPVYADPIEYPDALLQDFWNQATCFVSDEDFGIINGLCRLQLINLMTAHLIYIWNLVNNRNGDSSGDGGLDDTGNITSASIGDVSISVMPPPATDDFSWWINQTPYGKQFLALLSIQSKGGFYIGGSPERQAFRKVGGIFY